MIRAKRDEARARAAFRQADLDRSRADTLAEEKKQEARAAVTAQREAERLRGEAEAQVAKQLVSRAGVQRQRGDITLAALLDAEALRLDHSDPTRELSHRRRLAADLNQCPRPTHLFSHDSKVLDARFSSNGKWIVTGCQDGMVRIWDAKKGTVVKGLPHEHAVEQVAFRHHDTRLLTREAGSLAADGKRVFHQLLWDWKQSKKLTESPSIRASSYGSGHSRLTYIFRPSDTELQMISVADGSPIGQPLNEQRSIAEFSSSGEHVLVVTRDRIEQKPGEGRSRLRSEKVRCLLWTPQTGQITTLVDLPETNPLTGIVRYRFNRDQTLVAVLHSRTILEIYETASGRRVGRFENSAILNGSNLGFSRGMDFVGFSPDNRLLMFRSRDQISLFDIAEGKPIERQISVSAEVSHSHFSPDSKRVLSINPQGYPQLWHTSTGEAASPPLQHDVEVQQLSFSPDGHFVGVVYVDGTVRIWDSLSGEPAGPLLKHSGSVTGAAFSIDGSHLLVTAGENVLLWPVGWPQFNRVQIPAPSVREITPGEGMRIVSSEAQISPNGKWVVTSSSTIEQSARSSAEARPPAKTHVELRVWETSTGKEVHAHVIDLPTNSQTVDPIFSPDDRRILIRAGGIGRRGGPNFRFSANSQGETASEESGQRPPAGKFYLWSPESGTLAKIESDQGWDPASAEFSRDGSRLWTVFAENRSADRVPRFANGGTSSPPRRAQTQLWDCETGKALGPAMEHQFGRSSGLANTQQNLATGSPDGLCLAKVEVDPKNAVVLLDGTTGKPLGGALEHSGPISKMQFSTDGRFLLTRAENSDDVELKVWKTDSCTLAAGPITYPREEVSNALDVRLNSTATHVAIHSSLRSGGRAISPQVLQQLPLSTTVAIDELSSGERIILRHELPVTGADFSPDGRYLSTTSRDNVVRIWDAQHGELVRSMRLGVPVATTAPTAQFSDDGQRIVTRGNIRGVQVWDVATGQPLSAPLSSQEAGSPDFGSRGQPDRPTSWSSAADRFLLKSEAGFTVYDLSAEDRSVDELQRLTRVLSGRYVNKLGNVETLPADQLQREWNASIDSLRDRLLPAPTDAEWHREQLRENLDRFAEVWHLDRLILDDPNDGALYARRGQALAELNRHEEAIVDFDAAIDHGLTTVRTTRANSLGHLRRWREAADDLAIAIESRQGQRVGPGSGFTRPGNDPMTVTALVGLARLLAGDREGYEQACQESLSQPRNTARPQGGRAGPGFVIRSTTALQILLLVPRSKEFCDQIEDRFPSVEMPEFVSQIIGDLQIPYDGWIAYRRGQFARALKMFGNEDERTGALELLLMAMASEQLGESDEAIRRLSRAKEKMASAEVETEPSAMQAAFLSRIRGTNAAGQTWATAAIEEVLLREAEQVIEGEVTATDSETTP